MTPAQLSQQVLQAAVGGNLPQAKQLLTQAATKADADILAAEEVIANATEIKTMETTHGQIIDAKLPKKP